MPRTSRRSALTSALVLAVSVSATVSASALLTACSPGTESSPQPVTPEGYTLTEVPTLGLSLAVPADWTTLTSDGLDDDDLVRTVAEALKQDVDSLREQAATFHLISVDADAVGFAENLVVSQYELEGGLPPEEELAEITEGDQVNSSDYVRRTTGSGADAALYTASGVLGGSRQDFHIAFMAIMTGAIASATTSAASPAGGATASSPADSVTFVLIKATSTDRAQELADVVLESI
ncbi:MULTISPECIES: hypothetical protein [unclassified Actinomyces]|uniref:hypothetical protein n=1 Tax=unclassified Actinomyces TaxID=2609248 RepID=UPI0013743DDF|nr:MULTISPECIES: hypothetical protein [unclassified Actinomyces]NDR53028.1 hypothetical protein [Actinomyces sp. 565]QHO91988.1 hypothetical protein CWT12_12620 [Actinomyces sp. 432]